MALRPNYRPIDSTDSVCELKNRRTASSNGTAIAGLPSGVFRETAYGIEDDEFLTGPPDYLEHIRLLTEAVEINTEYACPRVQLGLTYFTMGDNECARQEWEAVLKEHPDDSMATMYMTLLNTASNG